MGILDRWKRKKEAPPEKPELNSFTIGGETVSVSEGSKDSQPKIIAEISIPDSFDEAAAKLLTQKIILELRQHNLSGDCKIADDLTTMTIQRLPNVRPIHPNPDLIGIGGVNVLTVERLNETLSSLQNQYGTAEAWDAELKILAGEKETVNGITFTITQQDNNVIVSWEGDQQAATQVIDALNTKLEEAGYHVRNSRKDGEAFYRPITDLNPKKSVTMDAITAQLAGLKHGYPTTVDAESISRNDAATRQLPDQNQDQQRG